MEKGLRSLSEYGLTSSVVTSIMRRWVLVSVTDGEIIVICFHICERGKLVGVGGKLGDDHSEGLCLVEDPLKNFRALAGAYVINEAPHV